MRESCKIAAIVLEKLCAMVAPGISTKEIDDAGRDLIESFGAKSACYNYRAGKRVFPAHTCLSVNEEVVHGIGREHRRLQPGDSITVDVCVLHNGYIGDNARTVAVGPVSEQVQFLLSSTEAALYQAIEQARPGNSVKDIAGAVQDYIEPRNLGIIREFVGHGVGRTMHEEPQIPNFRTKGLNKKLKPGMTLAIEPMISLGDPRIIVLEDGWTAVTRDHQCAAHFEHTVLVTRDAPEILTRAEN